MRCLTGTGAVASLPNLVRDFSLQIVMILPEVLIPNPTS